jgi:hypothetical protein
MIDPLDLLEMDAKALYERIKEETMNEILEEVRKKNERKHTFRLRSLLEDRKRSRQHL